MSIPNIFKACASMTTIVYSATKINDMYDQKLAREEKHHNEIIADGCNFTYQTYIKPIKKNNNNAKLTIQESHKAMNKTLEYVKERDEVIDENRTRRLVEDRLLLIKSTKGHKE